MKPIQKMQESVKSDSIKQDLFNSIPSFTISSIPSSTISSIPSSITSSIPSFSTSSIPSSTTTSVPTSPIPLHDSSPESEIPLHLDPLLISESSSKISKMQPFNSLLPKESFKFKLQIKSNNDASSQTSSLIVIDERFFDLFELKKKIRDVLDKKYGLLNYGEFKMIYKAENHCGAGNWLDNEDELVEFLNYYNKLKKSMKMILIIVNVQLKRKASCNLDEISHVRSSVQKSHSTKKLSRIPKENKIQEENINKVEVLTLLRDKYQCTVHNNKYCYVESDRHLNLTTVYLRLWIAAIVNNEADFDNLPCGPLFNMTNSTKVSKNSQMTSSTYPLTHMPLTIQYSQPSFQSHTTSLQNISKVVPELNEFLDGLDAIYGTGKYTQYFEIFEKHDIRVNLIPKISNEWWENKLQITSLGHVLTLKEEASKYIN
ncbi:hypothetical protein RclHR1_11620013 [Rhizophagus clarus]|uniref:PB1 domain-containing protein n=1 Tax=Rhizophagus clarus TaxID=94130 RepID=A0A2Z6QWL5_9GLOM|nr:hypothetical protein RclHR1_11620013 [Rhizophagus clarus]